MKPAPFDYVAPATVEEACRILSEASGAASTANAAKDSTQSLGNNFTANPPGER